MDTSLPDQLSTAILNEQLALNVPIGKNRKRFSFRGKKKEILTGKRLSMALLNKLCLVSTYRQAFDNLNSNFSLSEGPLVVSFINAHCLNLCHADAKFRSAILKSDLVFRDGKGMEILCRSAGVDPGVNMCGTDTIPMMLHLLKDKSVALLGTQDPYLSKAAEVLRENGNKIVLTRDGFHTIEDYIEWIQDVQPKIILLGMGMPKQELLSAMLKERLTHQCLIINGGAIIDQLGQRLSRAPLWMRKRGLEWLFRLIQEPRRLFKRYVVGNIVFLTHILKAAGRIEL